MQRKNVSMDDGMWERIDESAKEHGVNRSEWLREAARNKLQSEKN